jgi:hypothetical protein
MLTLRRLFALALVSVAWAANTNVAINTIVDRVDETMHQAGPTIREYLCTVQTLKTPWF